ncbi:MAG: bifunctional 5,10-methylenetetrahydrofolate dehydrogenase/5,10-methenyltetrahydrofolate cyclohydrolase [Bacteroidia bacterium]
MILIDGKQTAEQIKTELALEVENIVRNGGKRPHLAAILVGNDGASETYIASKVKACKKVGFNSTLIRFPADVTETELLQEVIKINTNEDIDGLIVQLPLPKHISEKKVTETILPEKDVDGFHPLNVGKLALNLPTFVSATPYGIMQLLERYKIETAGKHCVVLGRSNIVGSPVSILLSRNTYPGNCTVTLCHSRTQDIEKYTREADVLVVALGKPGFVKAAMVKPGVVVIDVGITRVDAPGTDKGYRIMGDVDFDEVAPVSSYITPVPGGVGPMTIVALLKNTLLSLSNKLNINH